MDRETYKSLLDLAKFEEQDDEFYEKLIDCMDVLKFIDNFDEAGEKMYNVNPPEKKPIEDEPKPSLSNEEATLNAVSSKYGFIETIKYVGED